jgi:hypothetical protein
MSDCALPNNQSSSGASSVNNIGRSFAGGKAIWLFALRHSIPAPLPLYPLFPKKPEYRCVSDSELV